MRVGAPLCAAVLTVLCILALEDFAKDNHYQLDEPGPSVQRVNSSAASSMILADGESERPIPPLRVASGTGSRRKRDEQQQQQQQPQQFHHHHHNNRSYAGAAAAMRVIAARKGKNLSPHQEAARRLGILRMAGAGALIFGLTILVVAVRQHSPCYKDAHAYAHATADAQHEDYEKHEEEVEDPPASASTLSTVAESTAQSTAGRGPTAPHILGLGPEDGPD
jgi:hypothetical protein